MPSLNCSGPIQGLNYSLSVLDLLEFSVEAVGSVLSPSPRKLASISVN